MRAKPLANLLDRTSDLWRDRILTGLTLMMVLDLFVVAPLGAIHAFDLRPVSVVLVILLSSALAALSRSVVPVVGIVVAFCLFTTTLILRAHGVPVVIDACLQATAWLLAGLVIIWVVADAVFAAGRITYHRVVGAVLLYLAIGLIFVALYTLVGALAPGAFQGLTVTDRPSLPSDLVYFSFATLTTVGYGDIIPVHPFARSFSNIEAILGQLYPATLLARLVSLELGARSR
jgi:hypothetical protein